MIGKGNQSNNHSVQQNNTSAKISKSSALDGARSSQVKSKMSNSKQQKQTPIEEDHEDTYSENMLKLQTGFKDPKMSRDDLINHQLKAVMKRYVSPYETKEEEERAKYLESIGQIKNKFPELKYTDMKHS